MTLNINLVDISPENCSTELWLGTSRISEYDDIIPSVIGIKPEKVEARCKVRPPCYPIIRRCSIVLRDFRTWHDGMPNHTDQTRIMLAFGYQAAWHGCIMYTPVPENLLETVGQLERYKPGRGSVQAGRYRSGRRVIEEASIPEL